MNSNQEIIERLRKIEERNMRVELDKKWEISYTRKFAIVVLTYIVILIYLFVIKNENPWINAIIPSIGFLLSTLALDWLRIIWQGKTKL